MTRSAPTSLPLALDSASTNAATAKPPLVRLHWLPAVDKKRLRSARAGASLEKDKPARRAPQPQPAPAVLKGGAFTAVDVEEAKADPWSVLASTVIANDTNAANVNAGGVTGADVCAVGGAAGGETVLDVTGTYRQQDDSDQGEDHASTVADDNPAGENDKDDDDDDGDDNSDLSSSSRDRLRRRRGVRSHRSASGSGGAHEAYGATAIARGGADGFGFTSAMARKAAASGAATARASAKLEPLWQKEDLSDFIASLPPHRRGPAVAAVVGAFAAPELAAAALERDAVERERARREEKAEAEAEAMRAAATAAAAATATGEDEEGANGYGLDKRVQEEEKAREADRERKAGSMFRMLKEAGPEIAYIAPGLTFLAVATVCNLAVPKLLGDFIDRLSGAPGTFVMIFHVVVSLEST